MFAGRTSRRSYLVSTNKIPIHVLLSICSRVYGQCPPNSARQQHIRSGQRSLQKLHFVLRRSRYTLGAQCSDSFIHSVGETLRATAPRVWHRSSASSDELRDCDPHYGSGFSDPSSMGRVIAILESLVRRSSRNWVWMRRNCGGYSVLALDARAQKGDGFAGASEPGGGISRQSS